MDISSLKFLPKDVAQFSLSFSEDEKELRVSFNTRARIPWIGVFSLPLVSGALPRDELFAAALQAVKALPGSIGKEAEEWISSMIQKLKESSAGTVALTLGDRQADGLMDVTVEVFGHAPGGEPFMLDDMTFTPPVTSLLDAVGPFVTAIPIPGVAPIAFMALAFARSALRAFHFA